jgi:hypothetical protein
MIADAGKSENVYGQMWLWMTCNELGYWQTAPGRLSIRPRNLTQLWYSRQCSEVFGEEHQWPNVSAFNKEYGGLGQNTSRVYFSTESQDPWTWAAVTEESGTPVGSYAHTIVGNEMGHCRDWETPEDDDPPDVIRTHNHQRALFKQWMTLDGP